MRIVLACALALVLTLPAGARAASPDLKTEEQKTLYTLGLLISRSLGAFSLSEAELALVQAGVADGVMKREQKLDVQVYGPKVKELQEARLSASSVTEKKVGQAYLDKAATDKGAVRTSSGRPHLQDKRPSPCRYSCGCTAGRPSISLSGER